MVDLSEWGADGIVTVLQWGQCAEHGRYPITVTNGHYTLSPFGGECPACKRLVEQKKRWGRQAIPIRFQRCTVAGYIAETPEQKGVKAQVIAFCKDIDARIKRGDSIVMAGNPGTGKTHLACAIAQAASQAGYSVLFTRVRQMIRNIRESWRSDSTITEEKAIKRFAEVDLLVLDEVGVQAGTENEALLLFDVLAERYENMKSTILISNLPWFVPDEEKRKRSAKDMRDYLGERLYDRFFEAGSVVLPFTWESYRGHAKGGAR